MLLQLRPVLCPGSRRQAPPEPPAVSPPDPNSILIDLRTSPTFRLLNTPLRVVGLEAHADPMTETTPRAWTPVFANSGAPQFDAACFAYKPPPAPTPHFHPDPDFSGLGVVLTPHTHLDTHFCAFQL